MKQIDKINIYAIRVVHILLILLFSLPSIAHAYSDPGSGLLLWQLLGSFCVGLLFYLNRIISYVKALFHKNDRS